MQRYEFKPYKLKRIKKGMKPLSINYKDRLSEQDVINTCKYYYDVPAPDFTSQDVPFILWLDKPLDAEWGVSSDGFIRVYMKKIFLATRVIWYWKRKTV